MKQTLIALFILTTLTVLNIQPSFAARRCNSCAKPCSDCFCPYKPCKCSEGWLNCNCLEDYYCRIGLSECQKCCARKAVEEFKCNTQGYNSKGYKCESKCECRKYRRALRDLDCKMKNIITECQKSDYKSVRQEIKEKVQCCHKCLIWPFYRCKCCN